jgi:hypothetical protein
MKRITLITAALLLISSLLTFCTHDDKDIAEPKLSPLQDQVRVQIAYDATDVAFKFTWKSQKKSLPASFGNTGKNYPGQFHDMLKHNGTRFDRLPSGQRMEEDRITFMIDKYEGGIQGFAKIGCAISCHTGMSSHHLLTDDVLDHWHWRGGRSGPMGYAEDAAVNNVERIRDNLGTLPTKFIRSGGDRLREDQAAMSGSAHPVLTDGLPRFVFNKGKTMPGNYVIPSFFLVNANKSIMTDPYNGIPQVKEVSANHSLIVVYQNRAFDPVEKVNAIDLAYLVWVATDEVAHLPAHLQDVNSGDFNAWKTYWATETGITAAAAALAKLDEVHQEWVGSGRNAMVTRSVGFIYNSDQHDITSERGYDASRNEWTVVLKRRLSTGSNRDADLSGLPNGTRYAFSFAMHDAGGAAISHDISMPLVISKEAGFDLQAKAVSRLEDVNWNTVPAYDTYWVKQSAMPRFFYDWLTSPAHPGAAVLSTTSCTTCHNKNSSPLLTNTVID